MAQLVVNHATLMTAPDWLAQHETTIIVDNGKFSWIGPDDAAQPSSEAQVIDAHGRYVLPAFTDVHLHLAHSGNINPASMLNEPPSVKNFHAAANMALILNSGVTTVRDLSGVDTGVSYAVDHGIVPGPRVIAAVQALGVTGGHTDRRPLCIPFNDYSQAGSGIVDTVDAARQRTRELLRVGAGVIKVMATGGVWTPRDAPEHVGLDTDMMRAIVEEADKRGVLVAAHAEGTQGIKNALRAGVKTIEHGYLIDDEGIQLMLDHDAWLVPTLLTGTTPPSETAAPYARDKKNAIRQQLPAHIGRAFAAGIKVALGTDSGVVPHGRSLRELGLMVDFGLPPKRALNAGTLQAAAILGRDDLGAIAEGMAGDLVLTQVEPLGDIHGLGDPDNIEVVIKQGRVVKGNAHASELTTEKK